MLPIPGLDILELAGIVASFIPTNIKRRTSMNTKILIEAITDEVPLPTRVHGEEDSGFDLYVSQEDVWIWPHQTKVIQVNCKLGLPNFMEANIRPRSSTSKSGILVHEGTIDPGYRGQVGVIATNVGLIPRKVKKGHRIAQVVFQRLEPVEIEVVDKVPLNSKRLADGFGKSGR
jgi:dUTP pyrophosphatase